MIKISNIKKHILVADDEKNISDIIKEELLIVGYMVDVVYNGQDIIKKISNKQYDLLILDNKMPEMTGIEVMEYMAKNNIKIKTIMMTAFGSINDAVYAMKLGAVDYITKPFDNDNLISKIDTIFNAESELLSKNTAHTDTNLIGISNIFEKLINTINKVRDLPTTILLVGESGTGKSVIAQEIHYSSVRKNQPFVHVNCAVLPSNLIESELFGHVRGSFTGAVSDKKGKFELAGHGTIFLDEISTLNVDLQAKLLTVLQERKFEKIGSTKTLKCTARIIAATNANLEEEIKLGRFRQDLFYRLNVITIECPPLRIRKKDIGLLVPFFVDKFNKQHEKNITNVSKEVYDVFKRYDWPGNVRELENTIERLVALNVSGSLELVDLDTDSRFYKDNPEITKNIILQKNTSDDEYTEIVRALEINNNHREKTAKYLGISRRTLQYRISKHNLKTR